MDLSKPELVRTATQGDARAIHRILFETGLSDIDEGDSPVEPMNDDHNWIVLEDRGAAVVGAAYFAPEPHSDRVWNLYALAVSAEHQRSGGGSALVGWVEDNLRTRGMAVAKLLLIDTSSLGGFAGARSFYRKLGYEEEARIRDYWADGDDKVTFRKSLATLS